MTGGERVSHPHTPPRLSIATQARCLRSIEAPICICVPTTRSSKRLGQAARLRRRPSRGQLVDWGNLQSHPYTVRVATIEDFYEKRLPPNI